MNLVEARNGYDGVVVYNIDSVSYYIKDSYARALIVVMSNGSKIPLSFRSSDTSEEFEEAVNNFLRKIDPNYKPTNVQLPDGNKVSVPNSIGKVNGKNKLQ